MRLYKFTLPTKAYMACYLHSMYGKPLVFSTNNYFGTTLLGFLTMRCPIKLSRVQHRHVDVFDTPLEIYLPRYFLERKHFMTDLPPENVVYINKHFENRMAEDLARFTTLCHAGGVTYDTATDWWCSYHGIEVEEHIGMDAIFKKEQRARQQLQKTGLIPVKICERVVQGLLFNGA